MAEHGFQILRFRLSRISQIDLMVQTLFRNITLIPVFRDECFQLFDRRWFLVVRSPVHDLAAQALCKYFQSYCGKIKMRFLFNRLSFAHSNTSSVTNSGCRIIAVQQNLSLSVMAPRPSKAAPSSFQSPSRGRDHIFEISFRLIAA